MGSLLPCFPPLRSPPLLNTWAMSATWFVFIVCFLRLIGTGVVFAEAPLTFVFPSVFSSSLSFHSFFLLCSFPFLSFPFLLFPPPVFLSRLVLVFYFFILYFFWDADLLSCHNPHSTKGNIGLMFDHGWDGAVHLHAVQETHHPRLDTHSPHAGKVEYDLNS